MDKVQYVHDYSKGLHERIHSNICPTENDMDIHVTYIDINSLRSISRIRENTQFTNLDITLSPKNLPTELIHITINAIQ